MNPSLKSCGDWKTDHSFCIGSASGIPAPPGPTVGPTTTTSQPPPAGPTTTSTPTNPGNGVQTPEPWQPGMVNNCNRFHLVEAGETCAVIASKTGVTVSQLTTWNKGIGASCTGMWAGYYLCTGVVGGSTQPPPANPTPQPIQDGMVGNCKRFHFVQPGQNCDIISRQYGITVANFIRWNPAAGANCQGLWAQTYACVGL
ncbi:LysM domain-containing protein-like protein 5 [Colletotrichum musicola]|uniref:LysM domain-containing protein-like protein 5 n=1 Tax=Colletotrichum musicola TaxID=2175873 RepID=A0A8H6KCR8_9PEZI|nr:LysM domain-containing protein-like protein 5 [Colletotrichum musicola]